MMASLLINSIRSSLNNLERSTWINSYGGVILKCKLKNLEIFVLCARRLGNDAQLRFNDKVRTLGSLLQRIHDAVSINEQQIQRDCFDFQFIYDFQSDIDREIGNWYNTLSDSLPQPSLDEGTEIVGSVLGFLEYFLCCAMLSSVGEIEATVEKITFFRNFIRFATLLSVETRQLENLLLHIQAVTVNAACIFYMINIDSAWGSNDSVQELNIIDPGVHEIYAQALISSKLSTQHHSPTPDADRDPLATMKDFIDSLLEKLWERVQMDTRVAISTSFQLQHLYDGLSSLRSMLKEQPNKFDEEIRELAMVVIRDAGVVIFSLYRKEVEEIVVSISNLVQRIHCILQEVEGKDLSISDSLEESDLPKTNGLGFIKFLLQNLAEMTSSEACYGFQTQFQMIHEELYSLRYSLGEIEEMRNEQKELKALWNAGVKVAYRIEFLIDQLVLGDFQGSLSTSFDSTINEILKDIKSINSEIHHASDIKGKKVSMTSNLVPSRSSVPIADEIVGLDDDAASIIDRLTRGSKQLKIIAVVGMPGIGKTTLATKVFNHPSVTHYFHPQIWCCVSQLFDRKKVLFELLNHIDPNRNFDVAEHDLAEKLRRLLKGKRYLIVLDDVWDTKAWGLLEGSFPNDHCGSRIMLTSRHRDVALLDEEPHFLPLLTDDDSWELLQKKLAPGNVWSVALYQLGKQIAANCKGLPLTVVVVAGLLANLEAEGWKKVLENISSVSSSDDHCTNTLELSYKHLPDYLKPCFLYFGLFPEDHTLSVKSLIWLWIAEGFVLKTESGSLEDVARGYMMDLVGRSLVIVSKKRSLGGVKTCRIHDLLHDFCKTKAKAENFFQLFEGGYDEFLSFREPGYMRRLRVRSEMKHFKKLKLFCPRVHSLLFFPLVWQYGRDHDISFIIPSYNRLRVLDIRRYRLGGIPSEIGHFLQLKYLSVRGAILDVPSSIGSLANLETFILDSMDCVPLPDTFWNLQKLRHLTVLRGFRFRIEILGNVPDLYELQSCSGATGPWDSIERLIGKFPNIRILRCNLNWRDYNEILIPDSLSRLESLHLVLSDKYWKSEEYEVPYYLPYVESELSEEFEEYEVPGCRFEFDFPGNLRKLKLDLANCHLHQSNISRIGKQSNLEVLKFHKVDFQEKTWDMVEGEFPKLTFLGLVESNIVRWTASEDQFPCLQKLILGSCKYLEEIPCCFENVGALEMIEISECSVSVNRFFERIREEQMEMGNSLPKIYIDLDWTWKNRHCNHNSYLLV